MLIILRVKFRCIIVLFRYAVLFPKLYIEEQSNRTNFTENLIINKYKTLRGLSVSSEQRKQTIKTCIRRRTTGHPGGSTLTSSVSTNSVGPTFVGFLGL